MSGGQKTDLGGALYLVNLTVEEFWEQYEMSKNLVMNVA
jgi:hypothetical protein